MHEFRFISSNTLFKHFYSFHVRAESVLSFFMSKFKLIDVVVLLVDNLFSFFYPAHSFISFLSDLSNMRFHLRAFPLPGGEFSSKPIFNTADVGGLYHFRLVLLAITKLLNESISVSFEVRYLSF